MKTLNIELKITLFALTCHLWYSNSELLIAAKQLVSENNTLLFDKISLTIFAFSYSLISAISIFRLKNIVPVLIFALVDGFAVYLRINVDHPNFVLTASIFYGIYTAYIIAIAYILKSEKSENKSELSQTESEKSEIESESQISTMELTKDEIKKRVRKLQNKFNATKNEAKKSEIESELLKIKSEN